MAISFLTFLPRGSEDLNDFLNFEEYSSKKDEEEEESVGNNRLAEMHCKWGQRVTILVWE